MKTKLLIIIGIVVITILLILAVIIPTINYKTWGNNELYYFHKDGIEIICDELLWQPPQNCKPVEEAKIIDKELRKELKEAKKLIKSNGIPFKVLAVGMDHLYIQLDEKDSKYESEIADILQSIPYILEYGEGIKRGLPNFNLADNELQKVLDHCQKKELAEGELVIYYEDTIPFYHYNTTHYIGTNSCQWYLLENHPDSDILCIPGIEKWVSSEAIRNSTHIYDKSTCQWYVIMSSSGDSVYPVPFDSSEEDYSNLEPIYMDNPNNPGELILDLDAMIVYENLSSDVTVLDCNIPDNPHKEYQCFRTAFSNCQLAKVDPDQYTIEGSPIHTNVTITDDCKIYGIIDTTTDVHGDRGIITSTCETLIDNQYGWTITDCDALNYPEMQFNFEMQLYPQILECEENGNTWVRERLECVVD